MRCVVVGLGSIGRRHARNLRSLGHDVVVVRSGTSMDEQQRQFLADVPLPVVYDLQAALEQCPDAVVVANPTSKHVETARAALEAGAHVFVEKPISHTMDGVDELIDLAQRKGRVLFVGYHFRYHPQLQELLALLQRGALGTIRSARFTTGEYLPSWHPYEDYRKSYAARADLGGGAALTQSHDIDTAVWLFGTPRDIQASSKATRALGIDVDDVAEFTFAAERADEVSIHIDYLSQPPVKRLELVGSAGSAQWDYLTSTLQLTHVDGTTRTEHMKDLERNDLYVAELKDFFKKMGARAADISRAQDAREVLRIALMAVHNRV